MWMSQDFFLSLQVALACPAMLETKPTSADVVRRQELLAGVRNDSISGLWCEDSRVGSAVSDLPITQEVLQPFQIKDSIVEELAQRVHAPSSRSIGVVHLFGQRHIAKSQGRQGLYGGRHVAKHMYRANNCLVGTMDTVYEATSRRSI
jgi:hypothetical protein